MKKTGIIFCLLFLSMRAINAFSLSPPPQHKNRYLVMALASYGYFNVGDKVVGELKLNYNKKYLGGIFWDKQADHEGKITDYFGALVGYTIPMSAHRLDLQTKLFYSSRYGPGLGIRPGYRFFCGNNFFFHGGGELNFDRQGITMGLYLGIGIGFPF